MHCAAYGDVCSGCIEQIKVGIPSIVVLSDNFVHLTYDIMFIVSRPQSF